MIGYALSRDNDIFVGPDGNLATVRDGAEVVQHVRSRLQFFRGEWFLDLEAGTPWFQDVFTKPANLGLVESIIKSRILDTNNVESLTAFSMEFDSIERVLTVSFTAVTTFGVIDNVTVTIND